MQNQESLEQRLSRSLAPVEAPDELWRRVSAAVPAQMASRARWPQHLAMAATLAALMTGGVLYLRAHSASTEFPVTRVAIEAHRIGEGAPIRETAAYQVQRYHFDGIPVTVVSTPDGGRHSSGTKKVQTAIVQGLAVSEWTASGRRWAMVSQPSNHRAACRVCHHA